MRDEKLKGVKGECNKWNLLNQQVENVNVTGGRLNQQVENINVIGGKIMNQQVDR